MKYTTNYNLYKPDYDDTLDVDFLNKNMDVLDTQLNGLDYVQNVNTSDNGLTFIKRDNTQINVPLDYLKLTGGTVTGDTEFTGTLTNNGKDIQKLFYFDDIKDHITPLIDWDKVKEVKGTATTTKTWKKNGKTVTEEVPTWAVVADTTAMWGVPVDNFVLPLKEAFTNYDRIMLVAGSYYGFNPATFFTWECAYIDWALKNTAIINIGTGYYNRIGLCGYSEWGTDITQVSTPTALSFKYAIGSISEIYGVKYGNN